MNEETLNRLTAVLERIADAQDAQVKLLQELHDIETQKENLADKMLEFGGLVRSYRMMIRHLQTAQGDMPDTEP